MNQENMTNEEIRIQKLMEQQASKDSVEDRRIKKIMEEQATHNNLEDNRITKIMKEQAENPSNEDRRIEKLIQEDAGSSLTHTGYNDGTNIYSEEEPAPVDNSLRVDQIDSQEGRADLSPVRSINPVRPVTAKVDPVNFADALEQWRYMSEKYRNARVKKENSPVKQINRENFLYNTNQFQKQYEADTFQMSKEEEVEPPQEIAGIMDQVQNKINYFQDNSNARAKLQIQEVQEPPQEIAGLIDDAQNKMNYFHGNQVAKPNPQLEEAPKYDQTYNNEYNENHNYIQNKASREDFRDRVISRLSTANLDIAPELIDENQYEEIAPQGDILKVSDVMTKNVISVIDSMTIEQVASIFNKKKIMGVPVIHYQTKQPVGMITMSDIIEHIFEEGFVSSFPIEGNMMFQQDSFAVLDKPVRDIMHTNVVQVDSETTIKDACKIMINEELHRIIITKSDRVKGIFTSFDAVRILAQFDVKI